MDTNQALELLKLLMEKGYSKKDIANSIGVLNEATIDSWLKKTRKPQRIYIYRLNRFYHNGETFDPPKYRKKKKSPKSKSLKNATVNQLIAELKRRDVNLATIDRIIPCGNGVDSLYIVDNIIRVAWTWVITPFSKKILKETGGPIVSTWLDPTPIKPDSKIIRLSNIGKE